MHDGSHEEGGKGRCDDHATSDEGGEKLPCDEEEKLEGFGGGLERGVVEEEREGTDEDEPEGETGEDARGNGGRRGGHEGKEQVATRIEKGGDEERQREGDSVHEEGGGEQGDAAVHAVAEQAADDDKGILQVAEDLRLGLK